MKERSAVVVLAVVSVLIVAAVVVFALVRAQHPSAQLQNASIAPTVGTAQIGGTAPEFSSPGTDGTFDLDKQNRPVLLEVFATWCPHCQRETAVLNRLYAAFKTRVAFIAIPGSTTAMDGASPESEMDIFAFMQRFSVAYPVAIYDPRQTVAREYIQGGYPTIAIIGKNKKILELSSGEAAYETLASELQAAIAAR